MRDAFAWAIMAGVVISFLILIGCAVAAGAREGAVREIRRDAIAHGAGQFVMDPCTGNAVWRWKGVEK